PVGRHHLDAPGSEHVAHRRIDVLVAAGDHVPDRLEHAGEAAHAGAGDSEEVDALGLLGPDVLEDVAVVTRWGAHRSTRPATHFLALIMQPRTIARADANPGRRQTQGRDARAGPAKTRVRSVLEGRMAGDQAIGGVERTVVRIFGVVVCLAVVFPAL